MPTLIFNTHEHVKDLRAAGFSEQQAEVLTSTLADLIDEKLATKRDLAELEARLVYQLTLRLGSMVVIAVGVVAALVKIL